MACILVVLVRMFNREGTMINRTVIISFILGILVALFAVHAYTVYQMRITVFENRTAITDIVTYLNDAQATAQPTATQQVPMQ